MIESMMNTTTQYLALSLENLQQKDIEVLRSLIKFHRKQYYELEKPLITDDEFDRLYSLLVTGEEKFGMEHDHESPTQEVNRLEENHFTKAPHKHAMMSLDNTYNADDLLEFEKRIKRILFGDIGSSQIIEYIVEYKFDGLGIALTYESGKLVRALTRGDGARGEDITLNALQINNIPQYISSQQSLEVRGEIVMSRASFEKLNTKRLVA
jgi:DNA ligase (NAD+)